MLCRRKRRDFAITKINGIFKKRRKNPNFFMHDCNISPNGILKVKFIILKIEDFEKCISVEAISMLLSESEKE